MKHSIYRTIWSLSLGLLLSSFVAWTASAAGASILGTYEIVQKTDAGPLVKVVVEFHLVNREASPMTLQSVLLSDFGYPNAKDPHAVPVTLRAGASQDLEQEFLISHEQFERWKRGLRPRVILTLKTPAGTKITEALRLERATAERGE